MNNTKSFTTLKAAGPHALFSRFLQRRNAKPTEKQFNTWDNDGGQGYDPNENYLAVVHGRVCRSPFEKFKAHLSTIWKRKNKNKRSQQPG
jgi:hypothetical protein